MKRLLAMWLVAALLLGGLTATGAETKEKVNLFQNPGFEETTTEKGKYDNFDASVGKPEGWGSFNGWTDDIVNNTGNRTRLTEENPYAGSYCANIRLPSGYRNSPSVSQTVKNLMPGGIYEIGFYARSPKYASEFLLEITFYKNEEKVRTQNMLRTLPSPSWKEYKLQFPFPEDADSMFVCFKLGGYGNIFLDDVFLYKISGKPVYTLETDAVFYYSDDPTPCIASVHALSADNAAVSFTLKEGTKEVLKKENVPFSGTNAKWEFPLSALAKEKTAYTLEALITGNGKATLLTEEIYRYPRPSRLRSDGVYLKDGEPFMPVMAHGINAEYFSKCKEAGINVVTVSYWYAFYDEFTESGIRRIDAILEELDKYDLMGIIGLYRYMMPSGAEINQSNTTWLLTYLKKHKHRDHIFAYSMMDEPLQNDVWCDAELEYGYKRIRDLDNDIPVLTVDCSGVASVLKRNMNFCDIFSCDAYYAGNGELGHWPGEIVKLSSDVAKEGRRTVYHLTMAFYWRNMFPTGDEIVHMLYQSFLNGAKGVGYYTINNATPLFDENGKVIKDKDGNEIHLNLFETDRWDPICRFGIKEAPIMADHFVFGRDPLVSEVQGEGYVYRVWERDGAHYVLMQNLTETETKTVRTELPFDTFRLRRFDAAPHALLETGEFSHTLLPHEYAIFVCEEVGAFHMYYEDGTEAKNPGKGEIIRAEALMKPGASIAVPLLGAYMKNELISLDGFVKTEGDICDTWSLAFTAKENGLSYKAFFWNGMLRP